jgi:hypothetical protein
MSTVSGLQKLKDEYDVFIFRNKKATPVLLTLRDGDHVQINPHARIKVLSANLVQLPSLQEVEPVQPTLKEIIEAGVLSKKKTEPAVGGQSSNRQPSTSKKEDKDSKSDSNVSGSKK